MRFLRENIQEMQGYVPGEQPDEPGWVKLNQNENPYPPSPQALAAMEQELATLQQYPASSSPRVQAAAARLYGVPASQIMVTNGSDEMLRILFQACTDPGEEAVAFYPSYTYYKTLAAIQGARFRLIEFLEDYGLPERLDVGAAKLVFLPNPNAPSGTLYSEGDIARLCAAARNGLVVVDEAYVDFAKTTALPLLREHENLFVARTLSKSYSLAGLRVGLGFGSGRLLEQLEKVRDFYNVDRVAQAGAAAALADQEHFQGNLRKIIATRERLIRALTPLADHVWPSAANFVLARFTHPPAAELFYGLRQRRVLVRHFSAPRLQDCLRISVGTDAAIDAFLTALRDLLT